MGLNQNTWKINQWYDQAVAGNVSYSGSGELWAWGRNQYGQLGQNNTTEYSSPVQIPGTTWKSGYKEIAMYNGVVAGKTDGTLWSWGVQWAGELGLNDTVRRSSPVQIGSVTTWDKVIHGDRSVLATKTDGTLWAWGYNGEGNLGQNNNTVYSSPIQIPGTTWGGGIGFSKTGSGFAIKTDGTLWSWGNSNNGALGQNKGPGQNRSSPIQIGSDTTWSKIVSGAYRAMATKTDGTLWSWGYNHVGQLGQGNNTKYSSPVQIPGTTWSTIGSNSYTSSATKTDGTLWCWGYNDNGDCAQNTNGTSTSTYDSPVQVPGTTWSQVIQSKGTNSMGAIKTDGTLWFWGQNGYGYLGQNNRTFYSSPVQIPGTEWSYATGGNSGQNIAAKNI